MTITELAGSFFGKVKDRVFRNPSSESIDDVIQVLQYVKTTITNNPSDMDADGIFQAVNGMTVGAMNKIAGLMTKVSNLLQGKPISSEESLRLLAPEIVQNSTSSNTESSNSTSSNSKDVRSTEVSLLPEERVHLCNLYRVFWPKDQIDEIERAYNGSLQGISEKSLRIAKLLKGMEYRSESSTYYGIPSEWNDFSIRISLFVIMLGLRQQQYASIRFPEQISQQFICPISLVIMQKPIEILGRNGKSYFVDSSVWEEHCIPAEDCVQMQSERAGYLQQQIDLFREEQAWLCEVTIKLRSHYNNYEALTSIPESYLCYATKTLMRDPIEVEDDQKDKHYIDSLVLAFATKIKRLKFINGDGRTEAASALKRKIELFVGNQEDIANQIALANERHKQEELQEDENQAIIAQIQKTLRDAYSHLQLDDSVVPEPFRCYITNTLMKNPVQLRQLAQDGVSYFVDQLVLDSGVDLTHFGFSEKVAVEDNTEEVQSLKGQIDSYLKDQWAAYEGRVEAALGNLSM